MINSVTVAQTEKPRSQFTLKFYANASVKTCSYPAHDCVLQDFKKYLTKPFIGRQGNFTSFKGQGLCVHINYVNLIKQVRIIFAAWFVSIIIASHFDLYFMVP